MAAADHEAGGDRLRASLQATDERYAEQYRQQQQRSQVMAGDATVSDKSHFPAVGTMTPQDTRASRARTSGSSRMPSSKDWDSQVPVVIEWQTTGAQQVSTNAVLTSLTLVTIISNLGTERRSSISRGPRRARQNPTTPSIALCSPVGCAWMGQ